MATKQTEKSRFWYYVKAIFKENTAERAYSDETYNYFFQRFRLAYKKASELVSGNVLEAGTGTGYGLPWISPKVESILSIDKYDASPFVDTTQYPNLKLKQMRFPPFLGLPDNTYDYVICFQVVEHIREDRFFLQEIKRVLKPGGKLIVTTPNKQMSLTRCPYHIREYTPIQLQKLLADYFPTVDAYGVFGNEKAMQYYQKNKANIEKITQFDIFKFQQWLPNFLLKIPYETLNRLNRLRMHSKHERQLSDISMDDFYVAPIGERGGEEVRSGCIDLFYIGTKQVSVNKIIKTAELSNHHESPTI